MHDGDGLYVPYDTPTQRYRILPDGTIPTDLVSNEKFDGLGVYATIESGHICLHGRLTAKSDQASQAWLVYVNPGGDTEGGDRDAIPTGTKLSADSIRFVVGATTTAGAVTVWWDASEQRVKIVGSLSKGQFVQLDGIRIPIDYS